MGKSTISMVIFNSKLLVYQRVCLLEDQGHRCWIHRLRTPLQQHLRAATCGLRGAAGITAVIQKHRPSPNYKQNIAGKSWYLMDMEIQWYTQLEKGDVHGFSIATFDDCHVWSNLLLCHSIHQHQVIQCAGAVRPSSQRTLRKTPGRWPTKSIQIQPMDVSYQSKAHENWVNWGSNDHQNGGIAQRVFGPSLFLVYPWPQFKCQHQSNALDRCSWLESAGVGWSRLELIFHMLSYAFDMYAISIPC